MQSPQRSTIIRMRTRNCARRYHTTCAMMKALFIQVSSFSFSFLAATPPVGSLDHRISSTHTKPSPREVCNDEDGDDDDELSMRRFIGVGTYGVRMRL